MPPTSAIRDEPATQARGTAGFGRCRRLLRPSEFASVLAAPRPQAVRAARHWLSMSAAWFPSDVPSVRFGFTVGKRNARRAIDRALVKRIVRDASRRAAAGLEAACAARGLRLDVAFRLKAARTAGAADQPSVAAWRRALRDEADALLDRLGRHLAQGAA